MNPLRVLLLIAVLANVVFFTVLYKVVYQAPATERGPLPIGSTVRRNVNAGGLDGAPDGGVVSLAPPPPPPPPAPAVHSAAPAATTTPTPPPPPPATRAKATGPPPFVSLLMPTVPRHGRAEYLIDALDTVYKQMGAMRTWEQPRDPMELRVIVMNNRPGEHELFDEAQIKFGESEFASSFVFLDNPGRHSDPDPTRPEPKPNKYDQPGPQVRKQTVDVMGLLDVVIDDIPSEHMMFMEDDVALCDGGLEAIFYMIEKANRYNLPPDHEEWTVLRASYGLNGIALHGKDVAAFRDFCIDNLFLVPIDLLVIEWFAGKHGAEPYVGKRPWTRYRYNIFDHLGQVSTFEGRRERKTPACFAEYTQTLWPLEAWKPDCAKDDISPCNKRPKGLESQIRRFAH